MLDMECNEIIKKNCSGTGETNNEHTKGFCEFEFRLDVWREFLWRFVERFRNIFF